MSDRRKLIDKIWFFVATAGYLGRAPKAPGTVASVVTTLVLWWVPGWCPIIWVAVTVALFFVGVVATGHVVRATGDPDPSYAVIDEVVGMAVTLWLVPKCLLWYAVALGAFRFFDILKPFPINRAERLPGGWGVMTDDLVAACMAWLIVHALVSCFCCYTVS